MLTGSSESIARQRGDCSWPELFTSRRQLNCRSLRTENLPFLEYLVRPLEGAEEDDSDDDEDEGDHEDARSDDGENDDGGCYDEQSNVRRFMMGDDISMSRAQVGLVANFCETSGLEPDEKPMAMLDERCTGSIINDKRGLSRPYPGPLTCQQLRKRLSRKRFGADSEEIVDPEVSNDEEPDAARRIVFITNLNSAAIEALVTTVALTQAPALQNLFYKHLSSTASIGVTIKSHGFRAYTLDFHIPYYALRESRNSSKDTRKKPNGEPLRQFWELPPVPVRSMTPKDKSGPADESVLLYEATTSIAVTGIDCYIWTAYAFVDTYHDSRESVDSYHRMKGRRRGRADPLAAGQINADEPIWDPRRYFLKVVEIRTGLISIEWSQILDRIEKDLLQSRTNLYDALSSNDPKAKKDITNFMKWNLKMTIVLRILGKKLSDTVAAWESFRANDIHYFDEDTVTPVVTNFGKLEDHLQKCRDLETELHKDNPDGLNIHLGIQSTEGTISQEKTARQLENLTTLTLMFFPLALAANLFSTTGVLPFKPNLARFTFVLLSLVVTFGSTAVVLSLRRHVKLQPMIASIHDSTIKTLNWGLLLPQTIQKARDPDLEMGSTYSPLSANHGELHRFRNRDSPEAFTVRPATNLSDPSSNWELAGPSSISQSFQVWPLKHKLLRYRLFTTIGNVFRRTVRPDTRADKQRIEWTCKCGHELYADISSRSPAELHRLASEVQRTDYQTSSIHGSLDMSTLSNFPSSPQATLPNRARSLDSHRSSTGFISSTTVGPHLSAPPFGSQEYQNRSFLELCLNTGKCAKTLCEIDLSNITSDGQLFDRIRSDYYGIRKLRFSLRLLKPSGIHFVKFSVQDSLRVGILQSPLSIPPKQEVESRRYAYSPCPLENDPPMPSDVFIHYLTCESPDPSSAWLVRLPKRLNDSVVPRPGSINQGWGIHVVEGPNWFLVGMINLLLIITSGVTAGLWKLYTNDFQGAIGFAGWIMGVVNAIMLVYIARWNRS